MSSQQGYRALFVRVWSSPYLREGSLYAGLQEVFHAVFGLLQTWVIVRYLRREEYGVWGYSASLAAMAGLFTFPGVTQAITYSAGHGMDGGLWAGVKMRLRGGVAASLFLWALAVAHVLMGRGQAAILLGLAGCFLPAQQAFESMDAHLMGSGNFRALFWRRLVTQASLTGGLFLAARWFGGLVGLGSVQYALSCLLAVWLFCMVRRFRRNDTVPKGFSGLARHLGWQSVVSVATRNLERPILSAFMPFSALAAYNLAQAAMIPVGLGRLIDRILFSRLARQENAVPTRTVIQASLLVFALAWPIYAVLALGVWFVVPWLFPNYQDSLLLITILLLQLPFSWASKPGVSLLLARKEHHFWYYWLVWGILAVRLPAILGGLALAGLTGVAWAWTAVEIATFVAVLAMLYRLKGPTASTAVAAAEQEIETAQPPGQDEVG